PCGVPRRRGRRARRRLPSLQRRPRRERARRGRCALGPRTTMGGGVAVKLGLMTAAFPDLDLDGVAAWSAANGFRMLEVACWPSGGGEKRRYAGVTHIDVDDLDPEAVWATLERHGLEISSLAYYPNNLHPDDRHRAEVNGH